MKLSDFVDNKEILEAFREGAKSRPVKCPSKYTYDLWRMSMYHYNDCVIVRSGEERCWLDELRNSLETMGVRDALIRMARWTPEVVD